MKQLAIMRLPIKSPTAVKVAARPTREWNAATAWGSSVGPILVEMKYPAAAPDPPMRSSCPYVSMLSGCM